MYFAGIDIGSVASKAVILKKNQDESFSIVSEELLATSWNVEELGRKLFDLACLSASLSSSDISYLLATGYGRVALPFANKSLTEISCHARGAAHLFPSAGLICDIGGQDSKLISLDRYGDNKALNKGKVRDFLMNDKCAAGTGRFLELVASILNLSLEELSLAAEKGKPASISSMCAVFAESEIIGLLASKVAPEDIAAGVFLSIARRTAALFPRLNFDGDCVFTGGLAKSSVFVDFLSEELGFALKIPEKSQFVGALGAALMASDLYEKESSLN